MPSRQSPSFEMANCFPSMQCLAGHAPSECTSNSNLICPVLPISTTTNPNMRFSPNSTTAMTSDSEESLTSQHNTFAKTNVQLPVTTSPSSTTRLTTTSPTLTSPRPPTRPHRRIPHTIIERRYRDNLNTSIEALRLTLPSLKDAYITSPDVEDSALPPRLPSKAMIIATAATYIKELESERNSARGETDALRNQVVELQKLIQCNDCSILQYLQQVGGNGPQGMAVDGGAGMN